MDKRKIFMIIGICIFSVLIIAGSTYAYYKGVIFNDFNTSTITHGLDYYINYAKGQEINSGTLILSPDYTGGVSTEVELWKKDDTYDIFGHIYIDINEIGENLSASNALSYVVLNNNEIIEEGSLLNNVQNNSVLLTANIPLKTNKELYKIYIWLDQEKVVDNSIEDNILSLTVRCEATMKTIIAGSPVNYVSALHLSDTPTLMTQENSGNSYYYSSSVNLMNDGHSNNNTASTMQINNVVRTMALGEDSGNIRFYGKNPNNYIDIGDTELDSEGKEVPTLYRIIGIFKDVELEDGTKKDLIKVVRNSSIGAYFFDNKDNIGSAISWLGSNDWSDARLMMLLNPEYENGFTNNKGQVIYEYEGSLYWNSRSGTCYGDSYDTPTMECDFTSKGLSEVARTKIETVKWNIGTYDSSEVYPSEIYEYERSILRPNGTRNLEWIGKIGLMYPSDYGYATDLNKCNSKLNAYNSVNECKDNNWLYVYDMNEWLLTPEFASVKQWFNYWTVGVNVSLAHYVGGAQFNVRPTFYLKDSVKIIGGKGTSGEPFIIN